MKHNDQKQFTPPTSLDEQKDVKHNDKKSIYWDVFVDILDDNFPKGKCKERGRALVLLTHIERILLATKSAPRNDRERKEKHAFDDIPSIVDKKSWSDISLSTQPTWEERFDKLSKFAKTIYSLKGERTKEVYTLINKSFISQIEQEAIEGTIERCIEALPKEGMIEKNSIFSNLLTENEKVVANKTSELTIEECRSALLALKEKKG